MSMEQNRDKQNFLDFLDAASFISPSHTDACKKAVECGKCGRWNDMQPDEFPIEEVEKELYLEATSLLSMAVALWKYAPETPSVEQILEIQTDFIDDAARRLREKRFGKREC